MRVPGTHVVLTTEGSYPHHRGTVSTWCESLLRGLPGTQFTILALMMNPYESSEYMLPQNVRRFVGLPLWGAGDPVDYVVGAPVTRATGATPRVTEERAQAGFVPLLRHLMAAVHIGDFDPDRFGRLIHEVHVYLRANDFRASTFRSPETVKVVEEYLGADRGDGSQADPGDRDLDEALRWLFRLLLPLNVPFPEGDVVHASSAGFCALPGVLGKIEHGTPFLLTQHGLYAREQAVLMERNGYSAALRRFALGIVAAVTRSALHYVDRSIPVCEHHASWEERNGIARERIRVVRSGVDPVIFDPRPRGPRSDPTVVTVGSVSPEEDLETLLEVAAEVHRALPEVQFLHYGAVVDGAYADRLWELHERLQLGDAFRFMGPAPDAARVFDGADVCCQTGVSDTLSYPVIEALMCGVPVVAVGAGGIPETIEGVGLSVGAADVPAMTGALLRLLSLDATSLAELEGACRDRALNRHSLAGMLEAYAGEYSQLAEARSDPRSVERAPLSLLPPIAVPDPQLEPGAPSLDSDVPSLRLKAFEESFRNSEPDLAEAVRILLNDPEPEIRRRAISAAITSQAFTGLEALKSLRKILALDPDPTTRGAAAAALATVIAREEGRTA